MNKVETYVPPKQLSAQLEAMGAGPLNLNACYSLTTAMRKAGMPVIRGKSVRPSDAYAFMQAHPEWRPFGKQNNQ